MKAAGFCVETIGEFCTLLSTSSVALDSSNSIGTSSNGTQEQTSTNTLLAHVCALIEGEARVTEKEFGNGQIFANDELAGISLNAIDSIVSSLQTFFDGSYMILFPSLLIIYRFLLFSVNTLSFQSRCKCS